MTPATKKLLFSAKPERGISPGLDIGIITGDCTMRWLLIALSIFAATETSAQVVQGFSANRLLPACIRFSNNQASQTTLEAYNNGICVGMVRALLYASARVCADQNVNVGEAVDVVIKYLRQIPSRHGEDFENLVLEALSNAYPCRR